MLASRRPSAPRVAHTASSGHTSHRGLARRHTSAPTSIKREQPVPAAQWAGDRHGLGLGLALGERPAAHALAHPPDVDLDAGDVGVVGLRRDRGRGVAADARKLGEVVGPAVGDDAIRRLPEPAGPARVAEPAPRGDHRRPVPRRPCSCGVGNRADERRARRRARAATCVCCSITSDTRTAHRSRVAARGGRAARSRGTNRAEPRWLTDRVVDVVLDRYRRADCQHHRRLRCDRGTRFGL